MPVCCALGCQNRPSTKSKRQMKAEETKKITFHRFPNNDERKKQWIKAVRRKDWQPSFSSRICSEHFTEACFDRTSLCYVRLREHAVPTIFAEFPSYLKKKHFADNQWEVTRVDGKKKLKANAVPTIFEMSRKRNSNVKKKRGRKCKRFEKSDEDDYVDQNLQTNAQIVMERLECFVCCCPLVNGHKVNLSSLTTTSGVTMLQCITGISNSEAEKLQRHRNDGMESLCNRCARLINYVDKMEAELALLKGAISGCLQVKSLNGDGEQLGADFTSHVLVLDEFESNLSGSNFVEKSNSLEQDHLSPDVQKSWNDTEKSSEPKNLNEKDSFVPTNMLPNDVGKELEKETINAVDDRVYQCQICRIKTTSRSVLFFHLRKHMATNQWCDFCDIPFNPQGDETANMGDMLSEVVSEVCDAIS